MTETWRDIPGYEGLYQVSDHGSIKNVRRGRLLKPSKRRYLQVNLSKDGIKKTHTVHRLVAQVFLGDQPHPMQVCHSNGNNYDNRLENLRWDTPSGNSIDESKAEKHVKQKLSLAEVSEVRLLYSTGVWSHRSLAEKFGVTHQAIRDIIIRKNYRWLDETHHCVA